MTLSFTYRKQAVEHARKNGYVGFRTVLDADEMWRVQDQAKVSPAAEWAFDKEWVHHYEAEWQNGGLVGVLVVTVTLDELHENNKVYVRNGQTQLYYADNVYYLVEPLTPSLWQPDPPTVAAKVSKATKAPKQAASVPVATTGAERAHSTVDSPVKRVWAMCDAMPGAKRQEIIAACVAQGINKSTAGTQYYHWSKKNDK